MSIEKLRTKLEAAKRQTIGVLNDLDEVTLPSGEKHSLADRLDSICGDCDAVIDDLDDLERWITTRTP
jgi:hypothetical protein